MKIISKYFWIVIVVISLLKLVLTSGFAPYLKQGFYYDDMMMFNITNSLLHGNWLGAYNDVILTKGIVFPVIAALFSKVGIPFLLGCNFIYLFASLFVTMSLRNFIKNKTYLVFIYVLILFNPISYAMETFLRFYRNGVNVSIVLIFFGSIINWYYSKGNIKKNVLWAIVTGTSFFLVYSIREDYIWLLPALALMIINNIWYYLKDSGLRRIYIPFIPIVILVLLVNGVAYKNYFEYKTYTHNELTNSAFNDAYRKILEVKANDELNKISVSNATLIMIGDECPSFKMIADTMIESPWTEKRYTGVIDGYLFWALRDSAMKKGYYKDSITSERLWTSVSRELDLAFKSGRLKKRVIFPFALVSPYRASYNKALVSNYKETLKFLYTYDKVKAEYGYTIATTETKEAFDKMTHQSSRTVIGKELRLDNQGNIQILNISLFVYKIINYILLILGIASYLYLNIKRTKGTFLIHVMFISLLIFVSGIAYHQTTAYQAIAYHYLAPAYVLVVLFNLVAIYYVVKDNPNIFNKVGLYIKKILDIKI